MVDDGKVQEMRDKAEPLAKVFIKILAGINPTEQQVILLSAAVEAHQTLTGEMVRSGHMPDPPKERIVEMAEAVWEATADLRGKSDPVIFHFGLLMAALTMLYGVLCVVEEPDEPAV